MLNRMLAALVLCQILNYSFINESPSMLHHITVDSDVVTQIKYCNCDTADSVIWTEHLARPRGIMKKPEVLPL